MPRLFDVRVNGESFSIELLHREHDAVRFRLQDREYVVEVKENVVETSVPDKFQPRASAARKAGPITSHSSNQIVAPIPGVIVEVLVKVGQEISSGDVLLRIEAMKMQNSVFSSQAGVVKEIFVNAGDEVSDQQILIELGK